MRKKYLRNLEILETCITLIFLLFHDKNYIFTFKITALPETETGVRCEHVKCVKNNFQTIAKNYLPQGIYIVELQFSTPE